MSVAIDWTSASFWYHVCEGGLNMTPWFQSPWFFKDTEKNTPFQTGNVRGGVFSNFVSTSQVGLVSETNLLLEGEFHISIRMFFWDASNQKGPGKKKNNTTVHGRKPNPYTFFY